MNVDNIYGPEDSTKFIEKYGVMSTCKGWAGDSIEELYKKSLAQAVETVRCIYISDLGYYTINLVADNNLNWQPVLCKYCLIARV